MKPIEKLMALVHTYSALADSVAHTNSPMMRQSKNFDIEAFRVVANDLSQEYPSLRACIARIHLSLSQLQTTAAKLTSKTDFSDQQMFSNANPCHPIWVSLQEDITEFDILFARELTGK